MPRRRERIAGFDRLTGIEIADLADRLMEVWPSREQSRAHIDELERSVERLTVIVADLRAELARVEREDPMVP